MRSLMFFSATAIVFALAVWAYYENYKPNAALAEVEALLREISALQKRVAVLNAEWAYLNRPDRLRALADAHFDDLGLLPFEPGQFGTVNDVSHPLPECDALPIVVETFASIDAETAQ